VGKILLVRRLSTRIAELGQTRTYVSGALTAPEGCATLTWRPRRREWFDGRHSVFFFVFRLRPTSAVTRCAELRRAKNDPKAVFLRRKYNGLAQDV
jgi:hypothetical protein